MARTGNVALESMWNLEDAIVMQTKDNMYLGVKTCKNTTLNSSLQPYVTLTIAVWIWKAQKQGAAWGRQAITPACHRLQLLHILKQNSQWGATLPKMDGKYWTKSKFWVNPRTFHSCSINSKSAHTHTRRTSRTGKLWLHSLLQHTFSSSTYSMTTPVNYAKDCHHGNHLLDVL